MKIYQREKNGIIILDIDGEIKFGNAPDLREYLARLNEEDKIKLILNFEKVKKKQVT